MGKTSSPMERDIKSEAEPVYLSEYSHIKMSSYSQMSDK